MNRRHLAIVTLLSLYFFIFGNWILSITSPDEGKNLDASLRMLESKDFIAPYYNCQPRFEKPPMFYWLTDVFFSVFGVNEFSARLTSGLSAVGVDTLVYLIGVEVFPELETPILGSLIYMGFIHNWVESRAGVPEMLLTFFMVLGLYLFIKERFTLGWVALAFAFLTKGPVGVLLPCGVYFLWKKSLRFVNLKGLVLFALIGGSWYLAMLWEFGFAYFYKFFLYENIMRFTGQKSIHPYPFWYYVPIIFVSSLLFLPAFVWGLKRKGWHSSLNPMLLWFLFVLFFYSVAKNKLHHYVLFLYPPLALIFAHYVSKRYVKLATALGALLILLLSALLVHVENTRRFVPQASQIVKKEGKEVYFYRTELSALVFYTRRCIPRVDSLKEVPKGSLVVARTKSVKNLNVKPLFEAYEFDRKFVLFRAE